MNITERYNLKFSGIYKITNTITNKSYIGQSKNICKRIYQHLSAATDPTKNDYHLPIHKAIRKYGVENFTLDVLERCSPAALNEREYYWVQFFKTDVFGYNLTKGGQQSIRKIKLTDTDVITIKQLLIDNKLTHQEIANQFNICRDLVHKINVGTIWYSSDYKYPLRQNNTFSMQLALFNGTAIQQLDLVSGEVLATFRSYREVTDFLGKSVSYSAEISKCCNGTRKSAAGYGWKRVEISKEAWLEL